MQRSSVPRVNCKSNLFVKSSKVSLGTQLTHYIVLSCNRFIVLSTQIIHKKQTQEIKKIFLILQYSTLKSTVIQYNSWHTGADIE